VKINQEATGARDSLQEHYLNMRSAYAHYGPIGEPSFTICTDKMIETIDYIFYTWEGLRPVQLLSMPEFEELDGIDPRSVMMEEDGMYDALPSWVDDAASLKSYRSLRQDTSSIGMSASINPDSLYMGEWVPFVVENHLKTQHLIPNSIFPSDHVSIKAVFEFVKSNLPSTCCNK